MATTVGIARITLYLEESFSLKDKRHVVRSIVQKTRNRFNVAVAEVGDLNDMRTASIAAVCVSNSSPHVDEMLAKVVSFVERNVELGVVGEIDTELIHVGD